MNGRICPYKNELLLNNYSHGKLGDTPDWKWESQKYRMIILFSYFIFLYFACLTTIQISVKCSVENSRSNLYMITNRWSTLELFSFSWILIIFSWQTLLFREVWNWCSYYKNISLLIDTCVRMTWLIKFVPRASW